MIQPKYKLVSRCTVTKGGTTATAINQISAVAREEALIELKYLLGLPKEYRFTSSDNVRVDSQLKIVSDGYE